MIDRRAMSCNGCRVLRKGCSDSCLLRPCLQWMESPEAQGYATVFVAKFFGRAGLMSFISSVSEPQRPALFQSLLLEACGRTINPVNGAAGLLWTGRWHLCQAAVETVLRGGNLLSIQELACTDDDEISNGVLGKGLGEIFCKRNLTASPGEDRPPPSECDLNLCLTPRFAVVSAMENLWPGTPSMNSDDSITTGGNAGKDRLPRLLNLLL
ncbi:LOB domain-containing protein 38 [Platanthera zijinensis]|uniref:LOB domain-containing protein 38 n=1 Tax=Platanthera zijinensis TaxID=2320716 RepID=A0AAP0BEI3_9ASPA